MIRKITLALIIASLLILPILVFAQEETTGPAATTEEAIPLVPVTAAPAGTGIIRGTVIDTTPGRNPIGGATVSYVGSGVDNRGEVKSDPIIGEYEITGLKPGQYVLAVHKSGYADRSELPATVVAGNDTVVEIKMRKKDTPITYFQKMGLMGPLLLLCSSAMSVGIVIMLVYIILRVINLSQSKSQINMAMSRLTASLQNKNVVEAVSICEEIGGIANMLKSGLIQAQDLVDKREGTPREIQLLLEKEKVREAVEETGFTAKEAFRFHWEFFVAGFAAIGLMAQLFGLLGTVTGIIRAFTVIALEGTGDPQMLAGGISEALLTSTAGMAILIPCLVLCGVAYIAYIIFEMAINNHILQSQQNFVKTINSLLLSRSE